MVRALVLACAVAARPQPRASVACMASAPRRSAALGLALGGIEPGARASSLGGSGTEGQETKHLRQIIAESGLEDWKVKDYEAMRDDVPRTSRFEAAIKRRLEGTLGMATVVDIGTGPFALLAVIAARAGARQVFAIEKNSAAAAMARETVAKLGLADTIRVIEGDSMNIELPERVDLVVSELIGSIATQEGVEPIIRDAGKRFLKEGGSDNGMIPARCQTCVAPIRYRGRSGWSRLASWGEGLRSRGHPEPGSSSPLRVRAADEATLEFLSEPEVLEDFAYQRSSSGDAREEERVLRFNIPHAAAADACLFSGFALWPRVVLDDQDVIEVRGQPDSHWAYVVALMSSQPVKVATPGVIELKSRIDYAASPVRYTFDADIPV